MEEFFITFEGKDPQVIADIKQLATQYNVQAGNIETRKLATGPFDAPLSPEQIKQTIEYVTCILKVGLVTYEFLKKVREILKKRAAAVVVKVENEPGKPPAEIDKDTTDEALQKISG